MKFFASCGKGLEYLLVEELQALGCEHASAAIAGANATGSLADAQRAVLWSRLASRVLWPLAEFDCPDEDALYAGVAAVDWPLHLDASTTIAVDAHVSGSAVTHARYAAQRVKDAVVDVMRERTGARPDVDVEAPGLRINLVLRKGRAIVSVDLGGGPMHRRGWRVSQGEAPLKENVAAAMLLRGQWPAVYADGGALLDPMCGSGTLLIEGALMAADVAPGLRRHGDALPTRWKGFDTPAWQALVAEARRRAVLAYRKLNNMSRNEHAGKRIVLLPEEWASGEGRETYDAVTARAVWQAWQDRAGQARTAAVFALVQQRTQFLLDGMTGALDPSSRLCSCAPMSEVGVRIPPKKSFVTLAMSSAVCTAGESARSL